MPTDEGLKTNGEPSEPSKVWRVDDACTPITLVAEADTREELRGSHTDTTRSTSNL
jgi:hypothetical protein